MIRVSEVKKTRPEEYKSDLHRKLYDALEELGVEFFRVDNDEALTMDDCVEIDRVLDVEIVKTIFLTNRQKTRFYMYITTANKPFVTKDFGKALGISRVSFAPEDLMIEKVGTRAGACSVFGLLLDENNEIRLVIDEDVKKYEWFGFTDTTPTGYLKIRTEDLLEKVIPFIGNEPEFITQ